MTEIHAVAILLLESIHLSICHLLLVKCGSGFQGEMVLISLSSLSLSDISNISSIMGMISPSIVMHLYYSYAIYPMRLSIAVFKFL